MTLPLLSPIAQTLPASDSEGDLQTCLRDCRPTGCAPVLWALVPAAGSGSRAGPGGPKQYRHWRGAPVLVHSLMTLSGLQAWPGYSATLAVLAADDAVWDSVDLRTSFRSAIAEGLPVGKTFGLRLGGPSRRDSVLNGLRAIRAAVGPAADSDWVLVHDAARPGLSREALRRLVEACLAADQGGLLALPIPDTIKRSRPSPSGSGAVVVSETISREGLWGAQTPQMFRLGRLIEALSAMPEATDESSAIEALGTPPLLVLGDRTNHKLTFQHDFLPESAEMTSPPAAPAASSSDRSSHGLPYGLPRMGQGFDVHALVEGRPLIVGGVHVPYERGLLGHSDADVLLHAISDAILGAACLGDIGQHFPDTDGAYKNADSRVLLRHVVSLIEARGLRVGQIDATIIAQAPKMAPHLPAMLANLEADTGCARLNLKATTTERLGFTGRGEGIAAQAIALLFETGSVG